MKNFMLLLREDLEESQQLSPQEFEKMVGEHSEWVEELTEKGIFKGGEGLDPGGKFINNSSRVVTDGPFAEAKEVVGGFYLIEAKDLEEAVKIAHDCPSIKYKGSIEVRPILEYDE